MIKRVDSGGQVHLVTNIRKPRKWRRYEYLQSDGNQWIDTKIYGTLNTRVILEFRTPSSDSGANVGSYFGCRDGQNDKAFLFGTGDGTNGTSTYFFTQFDSIPSTIISNPTLDFNKHTLVFSKDGYYLDNTLYRTYNGASSFKTSHTLPLFGYYSIYNFQDAVVSGKLVVYTLKLYDNDTLVRDLVPAQYNGEYGMWDLVEDKFYPNKGTGAFTVGPEMKNYDEIDEVRKTNSILPSGVELYDYIQSSGTQWIDTGYIFQTLNKKTDIKFQILSGSQSASHLFGATINQSPYDLNLYNGPNTWQMYIGTRSWDTFSTTTGSDYQVITDLVEDSLTITVNGTARTTITGVTQVNVNNNLYLLHTSTTRSGYRHPICKLYHFRVWDNNILKRNMLPCTYLGEPGMWDTVENKFYRNQGTGQFTLGNKITLKEYEYLQSDKNAYINTGVILDTVDSEVNIKYQETNITSSTTILGSQINSSPYVLRQTFYRPNTSNSLSLYNSNQNTILSMIAPLGIIEIKSVIDSSNNCIALVNGTLYQKSFGSSNAQTIPLYVFANNIGGKASQKIQAALYYLQISKNNQLVRDFIPVSYNGTPGLWDKVEWKFYANAGSGSFTLGPEKASGVYPVRTFIEYLQSTGTQYINLLLKPSEFDKFELDCQVTQYLTGMAGNFNVLIGMRNNHQQPALRLYTPNSNLNTLQFNYGDNYKAGSCSGNLSNRNTITFTRNSISINNSSTNLQSQTYDGTSYPIYLFNQREGTSGAGNYYSAMKVWGLKMYNQNILIRDFIPVRLGNIGALYDKIQNKIYLNSGSGNFTLGPDINT